VPPARPEWYAHIKKKWQTFWTSDGARVLAVAVDVGAAERLFDLYDERERAYRGFRKERFVEGSQGQMVLNPLGRLIASFDSEIRQLEDRLGFSPASRMRLGIEITPPEPPPATSKRKTSRDRPDPRLSKDAAK
jgi:P27 family predicted phage terminase small subunit